MMWKPGTAKPDASTTPANSKQNGTSPKSGGSSSKKLSSATMGMRFMQRKVDSSSKKQQDEVNKNLFAKKNNRHNDNVKSSSSPCSTDGSNLERKRDHNSISSSPPPSISNNNAPIILELASVVDMYGVGSDIIGRRSFGGFRKNVRNTWDAALKQRTDDAARTNNTKNHITDEELLARYEKYVKGSRGGDKDGGGKRKQKRKR
jgi:hypothetical protein